jgi:hypothetical protein
MNTAAWEEVAGVWEVHETDGSRAHPMYGWLKVHGPVMKQFNVDGTVVPVILKEKDGTEWALDPFRVGGAWTFRWIPGVMTWSVGRPLRRALRPWLRMRDNSTAATLMTNDMVTSNSALIFDMKYDTVAIIDKMVYHRNGGFITGTMDVGTSKTPYCFKMTRIKPNI